MSVIIKVDTGFVGATHEVETGMSVSEWKSLSPEVRSQIIEEAAWENIEAYAVDEENEDTVLS